MNTEYIIGTRDPMNRYRTQSLFLETATVDIRLKYHCPFTLSEEDKIRDGGDTEYKSLHKIYVDFGDPTEYNFAMEVFGSFQHWKVLTACSWFQESYEKMKEELDVKMQSKYIKSLVDTALNDGSRGTAAAKYLMDKGWVQNKGRPSKEKIEKEATKMLKIHDEVADDLARMEEHFH